MKEGNSLIKPRLTEDEKLKIARLFRQGYNGIEVARETGRAADTALRYRGYTGKVVVAKSRPPEEEERLQEFLNSFERAYKLARSRGLEVTRAELFGDYLDAYGASKGRERRATSEQASIGD